MKRILSIVAIAAAIVSCSYDDSDLRNQLSNTKQDIVDLDERIKDLEEWQETVNGQIATLQELVEKMEDGTVITNVQESSDGYILTFSDGSVMTVKHGAAGSDGNSPVIGIRKDTDGVYYWTLDGNWITDESGNKIQVQGKDGITPKLSIKDGEWQVSYDGGANWEGLGVYVGEDNGNGNTGGVSGECGCIIKTVTPTDTEVVFVLTGGDSFSIPLVAQAANLLLNFGEYTSVAVIPGESVELPFTVTGAEGSVTVEYMITETWDAVLEMTAEAAGTFTVTAPSVFADGKMVVFAADEAGKMTMKTICFTEGEKPVADDIVFADDFSWATGAVLCHATSGEKRWDSYAGEDRPEWSTTFYTGAGSQDSPTPAAWMRSGYVRLNYAKKPSNLVTPKLSKIEGTADLTVTFRACRYQTSSGPDGYHEIHVSCSGAGTVSEETIMVDNCNNLSEDAPSWNTLDESVYTFSITGATADTQIEFHFGPKRDAADYNVNLSEIPADEANCNCRMGFDDVVVKLAE